MHVASRTPSHGRDREQNQSRRETVYFSAPAVARASPSRPNISQLTGVEAISRTPGKWELCSEPDAVGKFLIREAAARAPYYDTVMRGGRKARMRRSDKNPIAILTVSLHPAASDAIAARIHARGADAGQDAFRRILAKFVRRAERVVSGRRWLISVAGHCDCDDLHVDCALARNDERGRFAGALLTVGPWCVATLRQLTAGAKVSDDKRRLIQANMQKFRSLHGDVAPLDAALADAMDTCSAEVLGEAYHRAVAAWAARVPAAECRNALAVLSEIDTARDKALLALHPADLKLYLRGRHEIERGLCVEHAPAIPPLASSVPVVAKKPSAPPPMSVAYQSVI
jgi:hypothetical protein